MRIIVLTVLASASAAANAIYFTGKAIPVSGPVSECSVPPSEAPDSANHQVVSEFTYLACKEYRDPVTGDFSHFLELAADGEYIRLIPRPGDKKIDPTDYHDTIPTAVGTCNRIRQALMQRAQPAASTPCKDLPGVY